MAGGRRGCRRPVPALGGPTTAKGGRLVPPAHGLVGGGLAALRLRDERRGRRLRQGLLQLAHDLAHGGGDDRAALPRAGCPDHPRAARAAGAQGQDARAPRAAPCRGALALPAGRGQPRGGGGDLLLQHGALLLQPAARAGHEHPLRARADDGALPAQRVRLHLGAHRDRPGAEAVAAAGAARRPLRHDQLPRLLRGDPHPQRGAARPGVLRGARRAVDPGPARRPAHRGRDRVGRR